MSSIVRKLNRNEVIANHWSINTMTYFEATISHVRMEDVKEALRLIIPKYPYLKMRMLETSTNSEFVFVENSSNQVANYKIAWNTIETEDEFNDWEKRLILFGTSKFFDRLFNIEVDVYALSKYRLYFSINHAGSDGRGNFSIVKDLMTNLDKILMKVKHEVKAKPFLAVHDNLEHLCDLESLKSEPVYQDEKHEKFSQIGAFERDEFILSTYKTSFVSSHFWQMHPDQTELFLQKCKQHRSTVQGILSVVKMISLLNETYSLLTSSSQESISVLNSIPCDMRYYFGLKSDDLIKGTSPLYWTQTFSSSDRLWNLAALASAEIRRQVDQNEGIKSWLKIINYCPYQKTSLHATSMGKVSLGEEEHTSIRIRDVRFGLSTPDKELLHNMFYVHAFTFQNRLNLTFSHSFPSFSFAWSQRFRDNYVYIIEQLIQTDELSVGEIIDKLKRN